MRHIRLIIFSLATILITQIMSPLNTAAQNIIPEPNSVISKSGTFLIDKNMTISFNEDSLVYSAEFLQNYLKNYYSCPININNKKKGQIELKLTKKKGYTKGEYKLNINKNRIKVTAYDASGVFYGIQSLIQLLPTKENYNTEKQLSVPCIDVKDKPRFGYRGMHLDVVRHIFSVDYLKKYIDYLAMHKMNYFHWHLTDDQGWRMESKSHPKLNEKGAYRDATIIGLFPGTGIDSTRYGGYYTIEQMKEIIDYAAKRYITIVPEIDMPAHCMAILATYPQLGTEPEKEIKPAITWGIYNRQNNVLAPRDETFKFLEDVFNEVMDIFPGPYIHIGADECAHKWWKEDPFTQQFIKEKGLKNEKELTSYFVQKVAETIHKRGRMPIGWDEVTDSCKAEGIIVMNWRDVTKGHKALNDGNKVILTPARYSYFNIRQFKEQTRLAHMTEPVTLRKVYMFEPVPDSLSTKQAKLILGGQGCLWTEYYPDIESVEYGIFPRMSAIAEVYWSAPENKDYKKFLKKMETQKCRYKIWGANSCDIPAIPSPAN